MEPPTPSLAARRRRATELELASTAARLMAEHGADSVTVETIASTAGVGLRTFYRYFRNKYDAIAPLLTVGASDWRQAIANSDLPITEAIDEAIRGALAATTDADQEKLAGVLTLLKIAESDPDLASVWLRVNQDSEAELRAIVTTSRGSAELPTFTDHLLAAAATAAMRVAIETWSLGTSDPQDMSVADTASRGFRALTASLADPPHSL